MPWSLFYLVIAYNQAEHWDDVLEVSRKALEHVTPESDKQMVSDFYTIIGDVYHTKKLMKEAYAAYDSALVYNPSNIGALNNYAYYLSVERRDLDKAEEMSYKTVKAAPNNATYLDTYAWILLRRETMLRPVSILTMPSRIPNRKKRAAWCLNIAGISIL